MSQKSDRSEDYACLLSLGNMIIKGITPICCQNAQGTKASTALDSVFGILANDCTINCDCVNETLKISSSSNFKEMSQKEIERYKKINNVFPHLLKTYLGSIA